MVPERPITGRMTTNSKTANPSNAGPFAGGIASARGLRQAGFSKSEIRVALRDAEMATIRRGWYALPTANERVRQAVRSGGILSCQSALAFHGVWTPDTSRIHVRRSEHGRRQPVPRTVVLCQPSGGFEAPVLAVDDVSMALMTAAECADDRELIVLMDSVMNLRLLTPTQVHHLLCDLTAHHRALFDRCDRSESGTETLTRLELRARGVKVRPQVKIPGVGRVDFVVGRCLVIEVDSEAHHTDLANYHRDRLRDQELVRRGYIVIRLTYHQVMFDLAATIDRILPVIRRDAHRRPVPIYGPQ